MSGSVPSVRGLLPDESLPPSPLACTQPRRRGLTDEVLRSLWRHRALHAVSLGLLAAGLIAAPSTGNELDLDLVRYFGSYLVTILTTGAIAGLVGALLWLTVVKRSPTPTLDLVRGLRDALHDRAMLLNGVNGTLIFAKFTTAYALLKAAMATAAPFSWDETFARLDRWLHFGALPHEWLWWMVDTPALVGLHNFAYTLWFLLSIGCFLHAAFARADTLLRQQYMTAFMLIWGVGGLMVAAFFSSAGPCYYGRLGLGDLYTPLMEALGRANEHYPVWALATQDALWEGFTGQREGFAGISAFPSMHVATAVLMTLYVRRFNARLGAAMAAFTATIIAGSVVLGWHYAVDGYASIAITLAAWKAGARLAPRLVGARD